MNGWSTLAGSVSVVPGATVPAAINQAHPGLCDHSRQACTARPARSTAPLDKSRHCTNTSGSRPSNSMTGRRSSFSTCRVTALDGAVRVTRVRSTLQPEDDRAPSPAICAAVTDPLLPTAATDYSPARAVRECHRVGGCRGVRYRQGQGGRRDSESVADEVGCSPSAVRQQAHRLGLMARPRRRDQRLDDPGWLRYERLDQGRSRADLAAELGCSTATLDRSPAPLGHLRPQADTSTVPALAAPRPGVAAPPVHRAAPHHHRHRPRHRMHPRLRQPRTATTRPARRPLRGPIPELADTDWLRARYIDEGMSTAQIAALLDCGSPAVRVALVRAGIDRRPPGGWWQSQAMRDDLTGR